jgi:hypothetical protein
MLRLWPEQTKKRWSEKDAGDHFRYDLWLAEARGDYSYDPAEQENNRKLKKELNGEMQVVHWTYLQSADFTGIEANRTIEKSQTFKQEPKGRLTLQGRNEKTIRCYDGSPNGFAGSRGQRRL